MATLSDPGANNGEAPPAPSQPLRFPPEALQRCARLTRRERDVLAVLATGASTDQVASRLRLSSGDVRAHVQNAIRTLQARSKLEAVLLALAAGIIDEPRS